MKQLTSILAFALTGISVHAGAQNIDTNSFQPRGARSQSAVLTPSASLSEARSWELALTYHHDGTVLRPEVETGEIRGHNQFEHVRWIDQRETLHLQIALTPLERFEFVAALPVLLDYTGKSGQQLSAPADAYAAIGDLRLHGRFAVLQPEGKGVAWTLNAGLLAPTGNANVYFGHKRTRVELGTSVGYQSASNWRIDGNATFATGSMFSIGDQILGDTASISLAFQQRFGRLLWFAEAGVNTVISAAPVGEAPKRTALEGDAGVRYFFDAFYLDAGLGYAPLDNGVTPQWRALASIGTVGGFGGASGRAGGRQGNDMDRDGIPDASDQCPTQAEDIDGFEDEDGCPDWDNDGDGIADTHDACPNLAEDVDGIEDHDGCPETDADADGIPDEHDACPTAPEDFDGFEDEDGCPEPGTRDSGAEWRARNLEELSTWFETNDATLTPQAQNTVRTAVLTLKRDDGNVVIQGHADDRGSDDLNRDLSLRRANAVRDALVAAGIDERRLQVEARGADDPLSPRTDFGRSMNRRVTFRWAD